jgi:hypothetical protein
MIGDHFENIDLIFLILKLRINFHRCFVCIETLCMQVLLRHFPHTKEVFNSFINNKLPWYLGGDKMFEAFYKMPLKQHSVIRI